MGGSMSGDFVMATSIVVVVAESVALADVLQTSTVAVLVSTVVTVVGATNEM
jgi:hypothetical protein